SERKGQYDAYLVRPDGTGERALLVEDYDEAPVAWLDGGHRVLVKLWKLDGTTALVAVDTDTGKSQTTVFAERAPENLEVSVSPSGRWLLYTVPRGLEIFVRGLAPDAAAVRVSTAGGRKGYWAADGQELFYQNERTVMAASFRENGGKPEPGVPRALFTL